MPGMYSNTGPNFYGTPQHEHVVSGFTFDGELYQIALERTEVARGASGKIFRGKMLGTALPWIVAVKVIPGLLDPVLEALLARELRAARTVSVLHPYILPFLGTADVGGRTGIVSVFMDNGNLKQYIKTHRKCDKKKLIVQVAEAVSFLHATMGLVHGDIKCENVLISYLSDALLADFGLSTFAEKSQAATATMTAIRGMNTLQFAAPELLLGEGATIPSKTRESDVYAFGMLVLEALSEDLPWPNHNNLSIMQKFCSGQQPERPTPDGCFSISHSWWGASQSCWSFSPHERPPITDILSILKSTAPAPSSWKLPINEQMDVAAYMPDGRTIVAAGDGAVILFDTTSDYIQHLPQEDPGDHAVAKLAVSPDGRHIAYGVWDTIHVLSASSGEMVTSVQLDGRVTCIAYSRDCTRIASGTFDGTAQLWDAGTGAAAGSYLGGDTGIVGLSFSADGRRIASASRTGTIHVWSSDPTTTLPMATLKRPDLCSMELSPDGMHVASGYGEGSIVIWDVCGARALHIFETTWIDIPDVAFSPSGRYVATAGEGGDIDIWDVHGGYYVGTLTENRVTTSVSVMFSPDGKRIISTTSPGNVHVWTLSDWISQSALL